MGYRPSLLTSGMFALRRADCQTKQPSWSEPRSAVEPPCVTLRAKNALTKSACHWLRSDAVISSWRGSAKYSVIDDALGFPMGTRDLQAPAEQIPKNSCIPKCCATVLPHPSCHSTSVQLHLTQLHACRIVVLRGPID